MNLWNPADGRDGKDFGTHGIFDGKSKDRSVQLWASHHHGLLGAVGAAFVTAGLGAWARRSS